MQISPALPLTAGGAGAPVRMRPLDDTAKVSGAPLAEPLDLRELIHHRAALAALQLQLQLPDGTLIRYAGLREISLIAPLWRAGPEGTLTQQVTGSVYKTNPGTGFFETAQGERLQPGFKVAIS